MQKKLNLRTMTTKNNIAQHHLKYNHLISNEVAQKKLVKNTIFSSQHRIIKKPLITWISDLRKGIQYVSYQKNMHQKTANIANIFNHAILIFVAQEKYQNAREICYSQIQFFINWSRKYNNMDLLKYVFQPWLNLIKIDRLSGNIYDALDKLTALNKSNQSELIVGENQLLPELIYSALRKDYKLYRLILTLSFLERTKIYFYSHRYDELLDFFNEEKNSILNLNESIVKEVKIVALANMGKIKDALQIIINKKINIDLTSEQIYLLRSCEIRALFIGDNKIIQDIHNLGKFSLFLIKYNGVNVDAIYFALHVAYLMLIKGLLDEAIPLINDCLSAAVKLNDDVLRAECLVMLYQFVSENNKKTIEDLMITHYFNTQYVVARKKMLNCCHDLIHVEQKGIIDELTFLFEEVLAYCNHYS